MKFAARVVLVLLSGFWGLTTYCLAQKGVTDTVATPDAGKTAQSDALFFDALRAKSHEDDKQAIELFEQFLKERPNSGAACYELAMLYSADRQKEKAEEYIKRAIATDKNNKWYQREYASLLGERGDYEAAANILAKLVDQYPDDEDFPQLAAEYFERAKKLQEAITYLDKALLRHGSDPEILMRKVQLYLELNDVEHAADVVRQMLGAEPKNGKYYKVLGEIYDNNNLPAKAEEVFRKAILIIPDDPSVQLGLAEHYLKQGDTTAYKTAVRRAVVNREFDAELQLKLLQAYLQNLPTDSAAQAEGMPIMRQLAEQHPNDADVLVFFGDFLAGDNRRDSAAMAYKKSLTINSSRFSVWLKLLQFYSGKADADSLIKYSDRTIRLFPNQALANYYNGIGHFNKKEYPAAIKAINRALDVQPADKPDALAIMYSTLGDIYNITKQYELSDNAFEKSLSYDANDASVLNNYSYYLSERGQKLDLAEKMSLKSLQLKPGEGTFLDTYGWILYKRGNYEDARDYVQQAIKKSAGYADGTLFDHLGNIYYKLNDKQKALENWKLAKEKGSDNPNLDKKISEEKLYE